MNRDYKVNPRDRASIARIAMELWNLADKRGGNHFNICDFVKNIIAPRVPNGLQISLCSYNDLPEKACVVFGSTKTTLYIVDAIWNDAGLGRPHARRIVAHEIGHLVLHGDEYAAIQQQEIAFSEGRLAPYKYIQPDDSCECQANTFADLFLTPDHIARKALSAETLAFSCLITDELAARRMDEAKSARRILFPSYEGDMCTECSNFTLVRNGTCMKCDTCGSTTGCQ